jgi:hypothetical protein
MSRKRRIQRNDEAPPRTATAPADQIDTGRLTKSVTTSDRPQTSGEAMCASPDVPSLDQRQGRLTVVASPAEEIVNTPVVVSDVRAYALQPDGGAGTVDMNGPATWF